MSPQAVATGFKVLALKTPQQKKPRERERETVSLVGVLGTFG